MTDDNRDDIRPDDMDSKRRDICRNCRAVRGKDNGHIRGEIGDRTLTDRNHLINHKWRRLD